MSYILCLIFRDHIDRFMRIVIVGSFSGSLTFTATQHVHYKSFLKTRTFWTTRPSIRLLPKYNYLKHPHHKLQRNFHSVVKRCYRVGGWLTIVIKSSGWSIWQVTCQLAWLLLVFCLFLPWARPPSSHHFVCRLLLVKAIVKLYCYLLKLMWNYIVSVFLI